MLAQILKGYQQGETAACLTSEELHQQTPRLLLPTAGSTLCSVLGEGLLESDIFPRAITKMTVVKP